jgi:hypothetical protein|tara:strand:- start:3928 stop:4374 length:447 start_codon:yes stop_codon:yes gene_type:complete
MNNLDSIIEMWKKDAVIDEMNLGDASRESAKLHSKYLELYSVNKLRLRKLEIDFKTLLRDKWCHYNGKLSKEILDEKGWDYDPLNGLTVLKGDMDKFYDSDPLIQQMQLKIGYTKEMVDTLKEIMDNIKWRHQSIKNAIEWHKFTSGV